MSVVASFSKSDFFKRLVDAFKDLVPQGNVEFTSEGMIITEMDSASVALVSVFLPRAAFDRYECNGGSVVAGMSFLQLGKVLKLAGNDDEIGFGVSASSDAFQFAFRNQTRTTEFELRLMDVDSAKLSVPDEAFSHAFSMSSKEFRDIVSGFQNLGMDTCEVSIKQDGSIEFEATGDVGAAKVAMPAAPDPLGRRPDHEIKMSFMLKYLVDFSKAVAVADRAILSLGENLPLLLEFVAEKGSVKYYLAPKLNVD